MRGARRPSIGILLLAMVQLPATGCGEHETPPAPAARTRAAAGSVRESEASLAALRREVQAAARRGIDFLLAKGPGMSGEWAVSTFSMLYRIAPDDALATRVRRALDEALEKPQAELPSDPAGLSAPGTLDPERLRSVLNELWRRRLTGGAWEAESAALQSLLRDREDALWKSLAPAQQLVFLDLLHRLDVRTVLRIDDVQGQIRWVWRVGDRETLLEDPAFLYAVTHVFYAASGYFQTRLHAASYPIEIEIFDLAMERYARRFPRNTHFVDISGEILAARRLMGLPETAASRALTRVLLRLQHPDGSWLRPKGFQDIHATASIVHGFLEWPGEFRRLPEGGAPR